MKKTLLVILALGSISISTTVRAEVYGNQRVWGFRNDWKEGRDFAVKPILENENNITVKTTPEAILTVKFKKKNADNWKIITEEINGTSYRGTDGLIHQSIVDLKPQIAIATGDGIINFPLKGIYIPQKGDEYELMLTIYGSYLASGKWIVGESEPHDVTEEKERKKLEKDKQYEKEIQKIEEELEKQEQEREALEMFQKQQQEEANKTWYQRLGDNIEDTWANVKGWWRG
ncbi:hypothetical protein KP781_06875 [Streptococcus equi subsp. zooepidemicus]|uniref:Putative exported protein n=2 Tax=Streptococcus equi TaxID=1336 RepID=C0MHE6_STRS7|nr:hypothetical protein [Streptococcus equi]MCD3399436.1 hypothetical protein [Streptococcus equi subsp. zooepidemicus]MCD3451259.1 hypothetical protein [Streptococcus equi subsp. zooepidemicus]MCD3465442.1 hypothetical protein [Streptococcus equi subsp. zooepidemicus]CAW98409.1 putative exported protein [Streptococcus equi subsp. zooepidemicus]HEL1259663.1 hypothetical protein [Streptococcus equi subsp. zooepidemicus]